MKIKPLISVLSIIFCLFALQAEENYIAEKTLIVSLDPSEIELNPIQSFSATEAQLFSGLYEGLVSYHPFTLEPMPGAAARWDILEGGKIYRFYLREDALYWNGDPVTASDFKETWLLLLDPAQEAPYSFLLDSVKGARDYRLGLNQDPDSVSIRALAENILEVELESPADHFLKILCHHSFSPLHPGVRDEILGGGKAPGLGNGPFYLLKSSDEELVFTRNELYWDVKNVNLNEIRFVFHDDDALTANLFNAGEIHWSLGNIQISLVENRQSVVINPLFATTYYFFSTKTPPFDNPKIRRALSLLLPWEDIRSDEFLFTPAPTLIPALDGYPEPEGIIAGNRKQALELLAEAGYPGGSGLPPIILRIPRGLEQSRTVTIMIETWNEVLDTEIRSELYPSEVYYTSLKEEGYTLGTLTWIGDFADPLTFLQMWSSDSNLNDGGYANPAYDERLITAASQVGNRRLSTLSEAEEILLSEGTVLPISHQPAFNVLDLSSLHGWYPNPLDIHPFKYMEFSIPELPDNIVMARVK